MAKYSFPPGFGEFVETKINNAVAKALEGINLLDLANCREELSNTVHQLRDMTQKFEVWHEVAVRRGDEAERLKAQVTQLENDVVVWRTEVAQLLARLDSSENRAP